MNFRRLAGVFALVALVFSFAETARASACELASLPAHAQHSMPGHQMPTHQQSMPNCPFSGSQASCTATFSMPTSNSFVTLPAHEVSTSFRCDVALPHAERTTAIFHPPRF